MQKAILSLPGSDGLVSLPSMMDHLCAEFPRASREDFIDEVQNTLLTLRRLGDLYIELQNGAERRPITVDEWRSFSLPNLIEWDSDGQRWTLSPGQTGVEDVFVQLSQGGIDDLKLHEIQARGVNAENK